MLRVRISLDPLVSTVEVKALNPDLVYLHSEVHMPFCDNDKKNAYARAYYHRRTTTDPEFKRNLQKRHRKNKKAQQVLLKKAFQEFRNAGCAKCGERTHCCLSGHHLDPSEKRFEPSNGIRKGVSLATFMEELSKCICVCHNCHAKIHAGLLN